MKSKHLRILAIIGLIIAILFFLWNSFMIYFIVQIRECDRIKVTNDNRNKIISAMEEIEDDDFQIEMLHVKPVTEVERFVGWHDMEITIFYLDGTEYSFITKDYSKSLDQLIQEEGYNVYLRSMEFVVDLIKAAVPLIAIVCLSLLISKLPCYNGDVEGRDYI